MVQFCDGGYAPTLVYITADRIYQPNCIDILIDVFMFWLCLVGMSPSWWLTEFPM